MAPTQASCVCGREARTERRVGWLVAGARHLGLEARLRSAPDGWARGEKQCVRPRGCGRAPSASAGFPEARAAAAGKRWPSLRLRPAAIASREGLAIAAA